MSAAPPMLESLRVRGFRSLEDVEMSGLPAATVLIGPNGAGKSNILRFLDLLRYMLRHRQLMSFLSRHGGAGNQLFSGTASAYRIAAEVTLKSGGERYDYHFVLEYAHPNSFSFRKEAFRHRSSDQPDSNGWQDLGSGHLDANLPLVVQSDEFMHLDHAAAAAIMPVLSRSLIYQFHNTDGRIKRNADVTESNLLDLDGGNLAAVLYRMEQEDLRRYERICRYIGRILPGFAHFDIEEDAGKVALRWQSDWSSRSFGAHLTSDGSLRLFALVTLLNMPPEKLPSVILLDEPELGLHPAGISLIGGMISSLATQKQVIVATQSPRLVDTFGLDQTFVLELKKGSTAVRRYAPKEYRRWLAQYSTGELWERNLLGGGHDPAGDSGRMKKEPGFLGQAAALSALYPNASPEKWLPYVCCWNHPANRHQAHTGG